MRTPVGSLTPGPGPGAAAAGAVLAFIILRCFSCVALAVLATNLINTEQGVRGTKKGQSTTEEEKKPRTSSTVSLALLKGSWQRLF